MGRREVEVGRYFATVAHEARTLGPQFINGSEDDFVLLTADDYQRLADRFAEEDPLTQSKPPYFDDVELPERRIWPARDIHSVESFKGVLFGPPYFDDDDVCDTSAIRRRVHQPLCDCDDD